MDEFEERSGAFDDHRFLTSYEMDGGDEERMMEELADEIESHRKVPISVSVEANVDGTSTFVRIEGIQMGCHDMDFFESIARNWSCRAEFPDDGVCMIRPK